LWRGCAGLSAFLEDFLIALATAVFAGGLSMVVGRLAPATGGRMADLASIGFDFNDMGGSGGSRAVDYRFAVAHRR
jgi:hypothetical protein